MAVSLHSYLFVLQVERRIYSAPSNVSDMGNDEKDELIENKAEQIDWYDNELYLTGKDLDSQRVANYLLVRESRKLNGTIQYKLDKAL